MLPPDATKPATARHGEPASNELLGGWLISQDTPPALILQVKRLTRRHALTTAMAFTVAHLAFGEAQ